MLLALLLACAERCPARGERVTDVREHDWMIEGDLPQELVVVRSEEERAAVTGHRELPSGIDFTTRQLVLIESRTGRCATPWPFVEGFYRRKEGEGLVAALAEPDCNAKGCDDSMIFVMVWETPIADVTLCHERSACEWPDTGGR